MSRKELDQAKEMIAEWIVSVYEYTKDTVIKMVENSLFNRLLEINPQHVLYYNLNFLAETVVKEYNGDEVYI